MAKSCKKGYYYCYTSKKCKKIPKGYHVMPTGMLMRDSEHKDEETNGKKKNGNGANGDGNGNGDSSGGSDGGGVSEAWSTKYKRSIDCDSPKGFSQRAHCQGRKKVTEEKKEGCDHEVVMARKQVKKSMDNLKKLARVLAKKSECDDLPAWVQAKITDTEHNTDAAAGYIDEARKSGDYSLRDWFTKSRASDGTPGWVQLGGKYAGKPCAKQPGQKTKPKCGSSKMKADLSDKEEESAFRRKNLKDKNPNRRGKPKNVATEKKKNLNASYSNWRTELEDLHEIPAIVALPLVAGGAYAAYKGLKHLKKKGDEALDNARQNATLGGNAFGAGARQREIEGKSGVKPGYLDKNMQRLRNSYEPEGDVVSEEKPYKVGDTIPASATKPPKKGPKFSVDKTGLKGPENPLEEGKKDACYRKVKSRYKIWPSAYASGALVKCRNVGAANWGNSTNESYEFSNWRYDFQALEFETINIIEAEPLKKVNEEWQKSNRNDGVDGMSQKSVNAYKRENPGSELQTAVTEKNPKGKRAKRRKSFCDRSDGQRKMHNIDCSKTPEKKICKARKRWRC